MTPKQKTTLVEKRTVDALEAELRQRTAERDDAVARETAITEVLQVINASPDDPAPVFDTILERATRLCEAVFGNLYTFDGKAFLPVAVHGLPDFAAWFPRRGALYRYIRPAVDAAHGDFELAIKANAKIQAKLLNDSSPVISSAVKEGKLSVVAAYYDLASGKVALLS